MSSSLLQNVPSKKTAPAPATARSMLGRRSGDAGEIGEAPAGARVVE